MHTPHIGQSRGQITGVRKRLNLHRKGIKQAIRSKVPHLGFRTPMSKNSDDSQGQTGRRPRILLKYRNQEETQGLVTHLPLKRRRASSRPETLSRDCLNREMLKVLHTGEHQMGNCSDGPNATDNSQVGTLLYVTDLVSDSDESLDFACQLAENKGIQLELVHVVDVGKSPSRPDAEMGIQYRLEALARRLRLVKKAVISSLLFGSPEDVISGRASAIKAKLIAFAGNSSSSARSQKGLVIRLKRKVACPVVVLSGSGARAR